MGCTQKKAGVSFKQKGSSPFFGGHLLDLANLVTVLAFL